MDCTNVASSILELMSVNNITPTIMQAMRNNLSCVFVAGMSPYPTVVTVWMMKYHAFIYKYCL